MGVFPFPRKVKIQTGDSNSEASSNPATDDESGVTTPAASIQVPCPAPTGLPALVASNIGQRLILKKGRRSRQRFENERLLVAIYGIESEDFEPDNHCEHTSYFTDVLQQHQLVDDFLNQEEGKYSTIQEEEEEEIEVRTEESFQAEEAFLRIGFRMRQVLKKNVRMDILEEIEDTINQNFVKDPESKFVGKFDGYERLLTHAVASYYSLNSHSFDMNGKRLIKVENPRKTFNPKDPGLAEYMKIRRQLFNNQTSARSG